MRALPCRIFLVPTRLSALLALALVPGALGACSGPAVPTGSGGAGPGVGGALGSGGVASGGQLGAGGGSGSAASGGSSAGGAGSGGLASGGAGAGSGGELSTSGGTTSGGAGGAGSGGESAGGSGGQSDCTPNPSGTFVEQADVVFDEKTCLSWMEANTSGDPYAEATTYCEALSLGGYDDWRLPTAGEVVSIFKCDGTFPPVEDVFTVMGDGIWTTTETGTIAGDLPKVCGAGQSSGQFYDFGQVGGQNTRCVRGAITLPDRADCKTVTAICP